MCDNQKKMRSKYAWLKPSWVMSRVRTNILFCSWDHAKRLQFRIGGTALVETMRTIACRQTEKASRVIFQPLSQRKLPTVKIRLADLALLLGGVRIVCGSKYSSRRHLIHERSDDRRGPDGHVDLGTGLRQTAREIVPRTDDIDPQSDVG